MKRGADFEELVAHVISHLEIFKAEPFPEAAVRVYRNKRYLGAKDPAGYEIDVSMEMSLPPGLNLLFIVECKAHERPVERSVVQQLIQVRDDISAHKAIIVSTHGFNEGAVRLAQKAGVALWQLVSYKLEIVSKHPGPRGIHTSFAHDALPLCRLAHAFFDHFGISLDVSVLASEFNPPMESTALSTVHFIYDLSADQLQLIPAPDVSCDTPNRVTLADVDAPRPKNTLLGWVMSEVASQPEHADLASSLRKCGFEYLLPSVDGLAEFETLIASADKLKHMDLRPRRRSGTT